MQRWQPTDRSECFLLQGRQVLTGVSLFVSGGATLSLPGVTTYAKPDGGIDRYFRASEAGSVLNLPALTTLSGIGDWLRPEALSGGRVNLPALTTVTDSYLAIWSDGINSVMNLPVLTTLSNTSGKYSYLTASNGGTVLAKPEPAPEKFPVTPAGKRF